MGNDCDVFSGHSSQSYTYRTETTMQLGPCPRVTSLVSFGRYFIVLSLLFFRRTSLPKETDVSLRLEGQMQSFDGGISKKSLLTEVSRVNVLSSPHFGSRVVIRVTSTGFLL